jgi:aspartate racemase
MGSQGPLVGVLGGMGPLATAHFLQHLTQLADGSRDQDHVRSLVYCNPKTPDRSDSILGCGPSPLPDLLASVAVLDRNGVDVIVIPCNTAHYWLAEMRAATSIPFISIIDAVLSDLRRRGVQSGAIGFLGTRGTLTADIYSRELEAHGFVPVRPSDAEITEWVEPAIRSVKAGNIEAGHRHALTAVAALEERGVVAIVLACTELPIALSESRSINGTPILSSTHALARACLDWVAEREERGEAQQTGGSPALQPSFAATA